MRMRTMRMRVVAVAAVFALVGVALLASCSSAEEPTGSVAADEPSGPVTVEMITFDALTRYDAADAEVAFPEDPDGASYRAELRDRKTGEVLGTFSEKANIPLDEVRAIVDGTADLTEPRRFTCTFERMETVKTVGEVNFDVEVVVTAELEADADGVRFLSAEPQNQFGVRPDAYEVTEGHTYIRTAEFPTTGISVGCTGVITVDQGNTLGLAYDDLQEAGFEMAGSSDGDWTASYFYNSQTSFSLGE